MNYKWGLDLGGTKIEGVILDENNATVARLRVPTEADKGYEHILNQINKIINLLKAETGIDPVSIGMGTPGALSRSTGLMKNSNTTCLIGKPLLDDVQKHTGLKFKITNDANCFAMAETIMGAVTELDEKPEVVFGVIMGTGVGGGVIVNGQIINGLHGIAGEWGHNVLIEDGYPCYCGKKGCVEKVIAGPALERYYNEIEKTSYDLKEIYRRYKTGEDETAIKTIDRLNYYFGKAISVIINILDPDVVVLGGGVGNINELVDRAQDSTQPFVFNGQMRTQFLRPKLGDSAGVFGAALL